MPEEKGQILPVPPEHAVLLWPEIEPHLRRALAYDHGRYEAVDVLAAILNQSMEIWVYWHHRVEAVMVFRIQNYPRRRGCQILWVGGGHLSAWLAEFESKIIDYAKSQHCQFIECGGRKGWGRVSDMRITSTQYIQEI